MNEIVELGGVWTSDEKINQNLNKLKETKTDEEMRRILYTQMSFMQKVLKCQGPSRETLSINPSAETLFKRRNEAALD